MHRRSVDARNLRGVIDRARFVSEKVLLNIGPVADVPKSTSYAGECGYDMDKSVLELTALSLLAATCCVAAWSLQVEHFPALFAAISLFSAATAMWRRLMTSR
jgi:hypothetical protein